MEKFNYENKEYEDALKALPDSYYKKYLKTLVGLSSKSSKILDVGVGSGTVLVKLSKKGFKNLYGVDVSSLFVKSSKQLGFKNVRVYDGTNLPYADNFFDVIGSFNVLEHTEKPEAFLKNQIKKLKKNGFVIIICPNFYTPVLRTNHRRIRGIQNRVTNIFRILFQAFFSKSSTFERIPPVIKEVFEYDDDSIVVTNPIQLRRVLLKNKCSIVYESGFVSTNNATSNIIDNISILRYMMPSCFIVAQKKQ